MDLEGIVSKRIDRAYGAGRCKNWMKVKNPSHPNKNGLNGCQGQALKLAVYTIFCRH
jgi:hypothetical protein